MEPSSDPAARQAAGPPSRPRPNDPLVSVVVPVFDEAACVEELSRRVSDVLTAEGVRFEIVFVDDGSADGTADEISQLRARDPRIKCIRFTRNFGHQAALVAGLEHASGDAVVTMDGDLQHPPEFLATLLRSWRGGADVVHAVRHTPAGEVGWSERVGRVFYRVVPRLTGVPVVPASADFRLLDRRVVDSFNRLEEHFVFARGLVPWLGFSEERFDYEVGTRHAGRSKYGPYVMLRLALDGVLSFSVWPLRLIAILGLLTTLFGIAFGIFAVVSHFTGYVEAGGWTSVVVLILIFGGVQLLSVGLMSEYVGRIYEEVKRRPRYVVESRDGFDG